ncbi:hypothetical protein HMN09_00601200 [Mycena chlorophos]|uniref:N-acetyltransferase domain-containing protein n=1 Tax=Mycena chlorophos TaxID=658473 RepID=A0A8H6WFJ7_MYCCL|nr:hypothetical protein HMN09_00601200 [Mycena chlorophos]
MTSLTFRLLEGSSVSDEVLSECAALFSSSYGVWSDAVSRPLKPGGQVKMSLAKLREQVFPCSSRNFLAVCTGEEGCIIGHAFATLWDFSEGKTICWVTQLVVSALHRQRSIATSLVHMLPRTYAFGVASSHPAACLAVAKCAHANMRKVDLDFICTTAPLALTTSPIPYLRSAPLRGRLFQGPSMMISAAFTDFGVDHREPQAARAQWEGKHDMSWPLGELEDRHEYLYIVRCS